MVEQIQTLTKYSKNEENVCQQYKKNQDKIKDKGEYILLKNLIKIPL
jgi:hypothetical protein